MSMSDWTDKLNGANMVLSTTQQYEGNKSLRVLPILNDNVIKTLDLSENNTPTSVNFDFWAYLPHYAAEMSMFSVISRYIDNDNFYAITLRQGNPGGVINPCFVKRVAGAETWIESAPTLPHQENLWVHWKAYFCEIANTFYGLLYRQESGSWVLRMEKEFSPPNFTSGGAAGIGAVNRNYNSSGYIYLDNVKIYYT